MKEHISGRYIEPLCIPFHSSLTAAVVGCFCVLLSPLVLLGSSAYPDLPSPPSPHSDAQRRCSTSQPEIKKKRETKRSKHDARTHLKHYLPSVLYAYYAVVSFFL
jgi:hypothetical protein